MPKYPGLALLLTVTVLAGAAACGDDDGTAPPTCAAGHESAGPACVPVLDECPDPATVPVLGGGCHPVGVTACASGFAPDGEGGCDPVLDACDGASSLALLGGGCQPVGVTGCASGFVPDGEGGCDPVYPAADCPAGTLEVLGHPDCQPLGDCGAAPWGSGPVDATTTYVDAAYAGGDADGTAERPFADLPAAVAAAPDDGRVIVAAGVYAGPVSLDRPVRIQGRCVGLVTVQGAPDDVEGIAVTVASGAGGTELRGITITGPGSGVSIDGATGVRISEVVVEGVGRYGLLLAGGAAAAVERSAFRSNAYGAVNVEASDLELRHVAIRDPLRVEGSQGRGLNAYCLEDGTCGHVRAEQVLITHSREAGVAVSGAALELIDSAVLDTAPYAGDGFSRGMHVQCYPTHTCGPIVIAGSVLGRNRDAGITSAGPSLEIEETTIRDSLELPLDGTGGFGIGLSCYAGDCPGLTVRRSVLAGNLEAGILSRGGRVRIEGTVVRDTGPRPADGTLGMGILGECDRGGDGDCGSMTVTRSRIAGNRVAGIQAVGVTLAVGDSLVEDTLPALADGRFGVGINAGCLQPGACGTATVSRTRIRRSQDTGVLLGSVDATLIDSLIEDTLGEESSGDHAEGVSGYCAPAMDGCGRIQVTGSVIRRSSTCGVLVEGPDLAVESSTIEATRSRPLDLTAGRGIAAQCEVSRAQCGRLRVASSRLRANRELALAVFGVETEVVDSLLIDTEPQEASGQGGRGINAQCDVDLQRCAPVTVTRTQVLRSQELGIYASGCALALDGVRVQDTRANAHGPSHGLLGVGVLSLCGSIPGSCPVVTVLGSVVDTAVGAGIALYGAEGDVRSTRIQTVASQPLDGKHGYGMRLESSDLSDREVLVVVSCDVQDADLASFLFDGAGGLVRGSRAAGSDFAVVYTVPARAPVVTDDNLLDADVDPEPFFSSSMTPMPAPPPW